MSAGSKLLSNLVKPRQRLPESAKLAMVFIGLFFMFASLPLVASEKRGQLTGIDEFEIPNWFKSSFLEIGEDAVEAADSNKHVLLFFHLNNCPYCSRMLTENFVTGPNATFVQQHFDCIELNVKGDREVVFDDDTTLIEKELAISLGVMYTPAILFVDKHNQTVLRLDGYRDQRQFKIALEFVQSKSYLNTSLGKYSAAQAPAEKYAFRDHPEFTTANNLQALVGEPLALVFEDENCINCNEVHDNLFSRPDVQEALSTLRVVRLDALSDTPLTGPTGKKTTGRELAAQAGLAYRPSVLLYDKGKEVMRIDSRLYSWYFNGFVKWVSGRHYEEEPHVFSWLRSLREQKLDQGEDVHYAD